MQNNGYQNLSLEFIDISTGGTALNLKNSLANILGNKIVILGDLVLSGAKKMPVVAECDISVSLSEEPDDWDEDVDGEFVPENIYSVTFKNVYGYDISIVDNVITTAESQTAIDNNIESVATALIEGGTVDNAKPIYCHPVNIVGSKDDQTIIVKLSCLIFNNDPTPFTFATFIAYVKNLYSLVGSTINIASTGATLRPAGDGLSLGKLVVVDRIYCPNATLVQVSGIDLDGKSAGVYSLESTFGACENQFFTDGVNKIN